MSPILLFFFLVLHQIVHSETDSPPDDAQMVCTINEEGEEVCETVGSSDGPLNHIEHIWAMPKDYDCANSRNDEDCLIWAGTGACEDNPGFMMTACPRSCGFCHLQDPKVRCQRHPNAKAAVQPGDIDKMFERILTDFTHYKPKILSRDPWLVQLFDVFSDEECDTLIREGGKNFQRSVDAGQMQGNDAKFESIVSDARTSSTDWCVGKCWDNEIINKMAQKAENITMIPKENSEYFQVLRYNVGQYYVKHHDYIFGHLDLPIGPRVYTFFIYLNTPTKGGGTRFDKLGVTTEPVKGSVAIWPSVLNEDPLKKEYRTSHEALPVEEDVKYAANMWLHMYNFHDPYKITCTG